MPTNYAKQSIPENNINSDDNINLTTDFTKKIFSYKIREIKQVVAVIKMAVQHHFRIIFLTTAHRFLKSFVGAIESFKTNQPKILIN